MRLQVERGWWTLFAKSTLGNIGYGAILCQNMNAINKTPPSTMVTITWAECQGLLLDETRGDVLSSTAPLEADEKDRESRDGQDAAEPVNSSENLEFREAERISAWGRVVEEE
jgi:hypothetical protein